MKTFKSLALILAVVALGACASKLNFPVSTVVPAADIVAKVSTKNNNYMVDVTAKGLASADRLAAMTNVYVVWVSIEGGAIRNLGQLMFQRNGNATLKTVVPFAFDQIIVTAEEAVNVQYPSAVEVSRVTVKM